MPPAWGQWLGEAVLAPAMYALIDNTAFHWNMSTTPVPEFPPQYVVNDDGTQGALIPYTREETLTITAKHACAKITWTQESMYVGLVSTSLILTSATRTRPLQLDPPTPLVGI
jgi:hypothetical protein